MYLTLGNGNILAGVGLSRSQVQVEDLHNQSIHSPLAENLTLPRSSLSATVSSNLTPKSPSLPPLKFHSSLLPTSNLAFGFSDRHVSHDHDDDESVASLSCSVVESDDDDYDEDDGERVLDSLNTPIVGFTHLRKRTGWIKVPPGVVLGSLRRCCCNGWRGVTMILNKVKRLQVIIPSHPHVLARRIKEKVLQD